MATGTGLSPLGNRRPVLAQPQRVIRAEEVATSAQIWKAVARAGETIVSIGTDWARKVQHDARTGYLAGQDLEADREATELKAKFDGDPAGFDTAWTAYRDGKLSQAESWAVDHLRAEFGKRGNAAYASLLNSKLDRDEQLNREALKARLKLADDDALGAVEAARDTPDSTKILAANLETYRGVLDAGTASGFWSSDWAVLSYEDFAGRLHGASAAARAETLIAEKGFEGALQELRTSILENEALSPSIRHRAFSEGTAVLRARRNETSAARQEAVSEASALAQTYRDGAPVDEGQLNEAIGSLKQYGAAAAVARLSAAAAKRRSGEALAGLTPAEMQQTLNNWRELLNVPPDLRAELERAAKDVGVDAGLLANFARIESRFNPDAQSTTTSAAGLFGFVNSTWTAALKEWGPKHGLAPGTPKSNTRAASLLAAELLKENINALYNVGFNVDPRALYVLHFSGQKGGLDLLKANRDEPSKTAVSVLGRAAAQANKSLFFRPDGSARPVAEFLPFLTRNVQAQGSVPGLVSLGELVAFGQVEATKRMRDLWPGMKAGFERGEFPDIEDLRATQYAALASGDKEWIAEVDASLVAAELAPVMAGAPTARTAAEVEALREKLAVGGWSVEEREVFRSVEQQFELQKKTLADDPVSFAVRSLGGTAPEPLNLADRQGAQRVLAERAALARRAADAQGVPAGDPLGAAERAAFTAALANADPATKAMLYGDLVASLPEDMRAVTLANLGSKGPAGMVEAWAGAMMAEDPAVAQSIIRGQDAAKTDKRFDPATDTGFDAALDEVLPATTFSLPARTSETGAYATVKGAVRARYADLSAQSGDTSGVVNENRLQQAVEDVTGGVLDHNGGRLISPERGWTQEQFDQALYSITDDELSSVGTLSGNRVTAEYLRGSARLESIGQGKYLIQVGVDPSAPVYASDLSRDPPQPFVLDLRAREQRFARPLGGLAMSLDLFERDSRDALSFASENLARDLPVAFGEGFEVAWRERLLFGQTQASSKARQEALLGFVDELRQATGEDVTANLGIYANPSAPAALEGVNAQLAGLKARHPDLDIQPLTPEDLDQRAIALSRSSRADWRAMSNREKTLGGKIGFYLAGPFAAGVSDPLTIATAPIAAPRGLGILKSSVAWAGIGGAIQAGIEVLGMDWREQVEPGYATSGEPIANVFGAAGGSAVLGGGVRAGSMLWSRVKTGQWPRSVRDAGNVIEAEAETLASNPYRGAGLEGEQAHRSALGESLRAVSEGRPPETPTDAFSRGQWRPGRVTTPDGQKVDVRYEVVEADRLVTSHRDDFIPNPKFPPELQPRDRTRASSQEQILSMASRLDPERLGPSPDAASGAPIVGGDNIVESGNARVLAIRRAYAQGAEQGEAYRGMLRNMGFDSVDGMQAPVLVARRTSALSPEQRQAFTLSANRATAARLSTAEQALADARLIDEGAIDALQPGNLASAANRTFRDRVFGKLPTSERGGLRDRAGRLSLEGVKRLEAALLARAYGDPVLLARGLEDADSNIKALSGALTDAAGTWLKLRDAVARGDLPPGMDVTEDLLAALRMVMRARDEGKKLLDVANQLDAFERPSPATRALLGFMFKGDDLTRPASRKAVGEMLQAYADEARKNTTGARLLGEPLEADEVLGATLRRAGREDLAPAVSERTTPEAAEEALSVPEIGDATLHELDQVLAANPNREITLTVIDDAGNETIVRRSVRELVAEADEEIRAAREIEACAVGMEVAA